MTGVCFDITDVVADDMADAVPAGDFETDDIEVESVVEG
jgi:hypothetical protein